MKTLNLLLLAIVVSTSITSCSLEDIDQIESENTFTELQSQTQEESNSITLVNNHRKSIGLNELKFDETVYIYSTEHSKYMLNNEEVSHHNFNSRANNLVNEANAKSVGENVAYSDILNIERTFNNWLDSEPHRKNIEGDFTHIAISIQTNDKGNSYHTQIFIKK